nr:gliding motility-associated C-terminal domain-containing protein [Saprospiraceae bacterium]
MHNLFNTISTKNRIAELASFFVFALALMVPASVHGSHIVGGELTYRCLGGGDFEFTLTYFRDCENALEGADFDNPAVIWIYDQFGNPLNRNGESSNNPRFFMRNPVIEQIVEQVPSGCIPEELQDEVCVERAIYIDTVRLGNPRGGFIMAYQRCCRNITLNNVVDPTLTGSTNMVRITQEAIESCNSAPDLGDFPALYTCRGEQFSLFQGATDADGDSVVYKLCAPFLGATMANPVKNSLPPPTYPFDSISWVGPTFSTLDMLGNPDDPLVIDPQTGDLSGTPMINGQFLIGICVEEYRNGILIGTTSRDFQINIRSCIGDAIADFELPEVYCEGLTVDIVNNSLFYDSLQWFVDLGNGPELFSNEENPTYTFPDTGLYEIILVASQDTSCLDTLSKFISVQLNGLVPDFEVALEDCRDNIILAPIDLSVDTVGDIVSWYWEVYAGTDTFTSTQQHPTWLFDEQVEIDIKLTITSSNGCIDSIQKDGFEFDLIDFEFVGDSVVICPYEITQIVLSSDSSLTYIWDPLIGLDTSDIHNPIVITDSSIVYYVTVTDGICTIVDSILVRVKPVSEISLTDHADSCDLERIVVAEGLVEGSGNWYHDPEYSDLIASTDTLYIEVPFEKKVYFSGLDTISNCLIRDSIDLVSFMVNLEFDEAEDLCQFEQRDIVVENIDPGDTLAIEWESNPIIISSLDSLEITIFSDAALTTWLYFEVENQFGCVLRDSIFVQYHEQEEVSFEAENDCGELEVRFTYTSPWTGPIVWDFGDGSPESTELNPVHVYDESGVYIVTLKSTGRCPDMDTMAITVNLLEVELEDTILSCFGEPVTLNPGGDPDLEYEWSPGDIFDDPSEPSPTIQVDTNTRVTVIIFDPQADTSCILYDTIEIIVPPIFDITSIPDTLRLCEIKDHDMEVIIVPEDADVSIEWYDDKDSLIGVDPRITIVPGDSEFYEVVVTDTFGCEKRSVIPVSFELLEFGFEFLDRPVACIFDTTSIIITGLDPDDEYIYEWMDHPSIITGHNSDTLVIFPEETVTYIVAVTNQDGCSKIDSFKVEPRNLSLGISAVANPDTIKPGEDSFLDIIGASDDWIFHWNDTSAESTLSNTGIRNPIASPLETTTYWVTVTDEDGCMGTTSVTVYTSDLPCEFPYVFLPNAFSPNGDGINDELYVQGIDIDEMELVIYNRYGQEVFKSVSLRDGWDGTFRGEELPPDVFAYYLWVLCYNGDEDVQKGNVSIIK